MKSKIPFYELSKFPKTMVLRDYCQQIMRNSETIELVASSDSDSYQELLNSCLVIPESDFKSIELSYSLGSTMREVLNQVITNEIRRINVGGNWKSQNLLSYGYRTKRWGSELEIRNTMGIECYFLNSLHSFFVVPAWEQFLNRVGEVVIRHILTRPLLIPVSNGSYAQISGQSLSQLIIEPSKIEYFSSKLICRSKLFYNARIYPSRILNSCILSKGDLSVSIVIERIFKLSNFPQTAELLFESTFQVCHAILQGYGNCSIWRAYQAYLEKKEKAATPATATLNNNKLKRNSDSTDIAESNHQQVKKKTRRGKRGGKNRSHILRKQDTQPINKNSFPVTRDISLPPTIGERLLSHTLRNGLLDMTLARDGYESQEEERENVTKKHLRSEDATPQRKRRRRDKQSMDTSLSSISENPLVQLPSSDDYGLKYYLEMRTMRVEHSSLHPAISGTSVSNNFLNLSSSQTIVSEFMKSICRQVFPLKLIWGTRNNHNNFMSTIESFIHLGRSETLSIHQLTRGYQLSSLPWISKSLSVTHQYQLFVNLISWIFGDFIVSVLAANFYITEGEGTGTETLYYKKRDWRLLEEIGMNQMSLNFMKTHPSSILQDGYSLSQLSNPSPISQDTTAFIPSVRFVPKKSSMRAITNMKRSVILEFDKNSPHSSSNSQRKFQHILTPSSTLPNSSLYNCLYVLRHLSKEISTSRGFGVDGPEEAYSILRNYLKAQSLSHQEFNQIGQKKNNTMGLKYYITVLDLEKCFDSVDTARLYDLILNLLDATWGSKPDKHLIHKYHITHYIPSAERFVTRSLRNVSTEDNIVSFRDAYQILSSKFRDAVFTDGLPHLTSHLTSSLLSSVSLIISWKGVLYPRMTRDELLKLLRQHLFSHIVRMKSQSSTNSSEFFTQIRGIPQGSVLSPLLCNLYYGDAENKAFLSTENDSLGLKDNRSVIVRVVDDYLMISTERDYVTHFLQKIHSLIAPFGGGVNPSKTKVNFDLEFEGRGERIHLSKYPTNVIPWCGLLINTVNLEITPSFSRLFDRPIEYSMSRECLQNGKALRKMMKRFLKPKCQIIVMDVTINSYTTVVKTIYQIFLVTALRVHSYMRGSSQLNRISITQNPSFLSHCISDAIQYGAILIRKNQWKCSNDLPSGVSFSSFKEKIFSLSESQWLGYHAFISVLSKQQSIYFPVIKLIQTKLTTSIHLKPQTVSLFEDLIRNGELDPLISSALWNLGTKTKQKKEKK